eukprot:3508925-Pleurochrysis_carterae.AAC.1
MEHPPASVEHPWNMRETSTNVGEIALRHRLNRHIRCAKTATDYVSVLSDWRFHTGMFISRARRACRFVSRRERDDRVSAALCEEKCSRFLALSFAIDRSSSLASLKISGRFGVDARHLL